MTHDSAKASEPKVKTLNLVASRRTLDLPKDPPGQLVWDLMGPAETSLAPKVLMLVNGFQRNRLDFRALRRRLHLLDPHLVTVAVDNRGSGETVTSTAFSLEDMAADVVRLFSHLDILLPHATRYLLGISMGGMIAQLAAAQMIRDQQHSDQQKHTVLDRLFLVSTTAGGPHRTRAADAPSQGTVHELLNVQDYPSHLQRMQRYFGSKFKASSPLLIETMAKNVFKNASADSEQHRATAQWEASKTFDGSKALETIKAAGVPVSVISGDEDLIMPLANATALKALLSPVGELVVYPGAGHLLLIEEPEAFASTIAASI